MNRAAALPFAVVVLLAFAWAAGLIPAAAVAVVGVPFMASAVLVLLSGLLIEARRG